MAAYKNKQTYNIDTYRTYLSGTLSSKVGFLRPGELFNGNDLGSVIQITSGEDIGRFVYERDCVLVTAPPPPPPPAGGRIVLTEPDGRQRIFVEVL